MRPWAPITALSLWLLFILATAAAPLVGVVVWLLTGDGSHVSRNFKAADKSAAAFLGWSGDKTVSNELGDCETCKLSRLLCPLLDVALQEGHCSRSK